MHNVHINAGRRWATGWMIGGSSPGRGWEFFSPQPRPDRLWSPPRHLYNGYQSSLPGGKAAGTWPLTFI